jgi:thioredoxin 1
MEITADTGSLIGYLLAGAVVAYILYSFIAVRKRMNRPVSEFVKILTDETFEASVRNGVSLIDFWAPWCGPCKVQGPIVDEVAEEIKTGASICKVNVDENPKTASYFGIKNIPTLLILKDGKPVQKFVGLKSRKVLLQALRNTIS